MKPAFVAAIVLTFAVYLAPRGYAEQKSPKKAQTAQQKTPPSTVVIFDASEQHPQDHNESAKGKSPHWYESSEWVLVIIAGVTAGFICWQSLEMRRAANESRKSVAALVSSEQAWLLVDGVSSPHVETIELNYSNGHNYAAPKVIEFSYRIRNHGRTPGIVYAINAEFEIGDDLRYPPSAQTVFSADGKIAEHIVTTLEAWSPPAQRMYDADELITRTALGQLWAYGFIRYYTVHGERFETRFCYRYHIPSQGEGHFRTDGRAEYNRTTKIKDS